MSESDQRQAEGAGPSVMNERRSVTISAASLVEPDGASLPARQLFLQESLEEVPDAWLVLRAAWDHLEPEGILTASYGHGGAWRLDDSSADDLLRLAGFRLVHRRTHGPGIEVRARRVARERRALTCSVIVPCRNEVGNVENVARRIPALGTHTEIIFVDGESTDGTPELIEHIVADHPERDITLLHQRGRGGKAAAVYQGFDAAQGDVMMILDADMTVAPEDLPRFYYALAENVADFAIGNRFAYPMEIGAMKPLNNAGNRAFGAFFSWLLGTRISDSLCGTKALFRADWPAIARSRPLFGGHDPWGDFDLLLGAAYSGLRLIDVPVAYRARVAGESKMHPFRHGAALGRTCLAGVRRLKLERGRLVEQGH